MNVGPHNIEQYSAKIVKKCPTFYEELFEVAENITTLDLTTFSSELGLKILKTIVKFGRMKSIKKFKFWEIGVNTLTPEHLDLLKGLRLECLDLAFSMFGPVIVDWFQLVTLSQNTLTSLSMNIFTPDPAILMNFQPMPKLKELKLEVCVVSNLIPNWNNFTHIFPSLKELNLGVDFISTGNDINFPISDEGNPSPNMKSLILGKNRMKMGTFNRILTIFPSLKMLECRITEIDGEEVIRGIWTHMIQLEDLKISGTLELPVNLDSLVTGIPVEEIKKMKKKDFLGSFQQHNSEIRTEQILLKTNKYKSKVPSIRNLTNLRSLYVNLTIRSKFLRKENALTDVTASFAFYSLKNLRRLSVQSCEISKDCLEVLVKDLGLQTRIFVGSSKLGRQIHSFEFESS